MKPFRSKMMVSQSRCTAGNAIHVATHHLREPGWLRGSRSVNWSVIALLTSKDWWHFPLSRDEYCGGGRKRDLC